MNNTRFSPRLEDWLPDRDERPSEPQPIGEILAELLTRYRERFPGVRIALAEASGASGCRDNYAVLQQ